MFVFCDVMLINDSVVLGDEAVPELALEILLLEPTGVEAMLVDVAGPETEL